MQRTTRKTISILIALAAAAAAANEPVPPAAWELKSPDGRFVLHVAVRDFETKKACPVYRVTRDGKEIISASTLGLELGDGPLDRGFRVAAARSTTEDSTWKPVLGERSEIRDHYNQLTLDLRESSAPLRSLTLTFRSYNEGVAFNYTLTAAEKSAQTVIRREQSEFRFTGDFPAWAGYSAQCVYARTPLSTLKPGCERPLVIELDNKLYVALAEAKLVDYARMRLAPLPGVAHALVSDLAGDVRAPLPLTTPWRVILAAERPGQLVENNFIIANLNDPCAIEDTSWIKPGTIIREASLTTTGGKACVDFAVQHGLQYILFDAGWYGDEYDEKSDATTVTLDPKRSKGPLDLQEVIRYGNERGIGTILYVNRRALEKQLDQLLPLYQKWGVKGVKYGFVQVGPQQWTSFLHHAIRKAAEHKLMVDVHDEYRPTGYERTYPNLMTVEGIRGDEATPPPGLAVANAFVRAIAGPSDHTVCYFDKRVAANWTHAGQLAKPVVFFGPWHSLFWYDRPAQITGAPELEFWRDLPTVWDETRFLEGEIGQHVVVARRNGARWYLGFLNAGEARTLKLPLEFLPPGKTFRAMILSDDATLETRTKVRIETRDLRREDTIDLKAAANGGMAIRLQPAAPATADFNPNQAVETDSRIHSDGKGWRVEKAKVSDPARPRVLLVGDSILNGYLKATIKALEGKAYVDAWVTPGCQSTQYNKQLAEVLEKNGPYQVIHLNTGLHGWQPGRIKEGTFEPLMEALVKTVNEKNPGARFIWASSTPVTVKRKPTELDPVINPVMIEQNRMAAEVMARLTIPVNDFYGLLSGRLELARGDQFHWKGPAYDLLAQACAKSVLELIFTETAQSKKP
jgi:alpha-glucosidase